jgi:hypothetical protein
MFINLSFVGVIWWYVPRDWRREEKSFYYLLKVAKKFGLDAEARFSQNDNKLAHLIEPALAKYATTTEGMFSTRWRNAPTIDSYENGPQNRAMVAPIQRRMSDSACFGDYHRPAVA